MLAAGEIHKLGVPVRQVLEDYLREQVLEKAEQGVR
jgi:hypothetical protein